MDWINAFTAAACALSAVLAWIAKIWWSKEFAAAKDEIIRAKESQIALLEREIKSLQEMTPMKVREYYLSVKEQLSEWIETLKADLQKALEEISAKDQMIAEYKKVGGLQEEIVMRLEEERQRLQVSVSSLQAAISQKLNEHTFAVMEKSHVNLRSFLQTTSCNKNTDGLLGIASTLATWGEMENVFNTTDFQNIFKSKVIDLLGKDEKK
jgi:hypothetical protein